MDPTATVDPNAETADPSGISPQQQVPGGVDMLGQGQPQLEQADGTIGEAIDDARDNDQLAPEPDRREVPEETKALCRKLWVETNGGLDMESAIRQWRADKHTLFGDPLEDVDGKDPIDSTFSKILRNRDLTVALTIPDDHSVEWKPEDMVPDPNAPPGAPMGSDPQISGLGTTLTLLVRRYAAECRLQEMLEALVRDGASFRWAVIKCAWSSDFHTSSITSRKPIDDQESHARLTVLMHQYQTGDFDKNNALYGEMIRLAEGCFGKSTLTLNGGFAIDIIPFSHFGISNEVRTFEQFYHARHMHESIVMTRSAILGKWRYSKDPETGEESGICVEDLLGATVYDDQGVEILQDEAQRQRTNTFAAGDQPLRQVNDDDLLLVREVWSRVDQRVYVLVRGLEYFAADYVPENQPDQWYPYVALQFTNHSDRVYGVSDTEIQAPIEREIRDLENEEGKARRGSFPRFLVDSGVVDEESAIDVNDIPPYGFKSIKSSGSGTFKDAFYMLPAANMFNEKLYDTTKLEQRRDAAAMLPSQLSGDTGGADFSSEVQLAARGTSILTKRKQTIVRRVAERIYKIMAESLLFNVGQSFVQSRLGKFAVWPSKHPDRMSVYQNLQVKVKVSLNGDMERAGKIADAIKLLQTLESLKVPIDTIGVGKFLAHLFGEESDIDLIVHGTPQSYVQGLVQGGPQVIQSLPLPALQALVQMGQMAQQAAQQQQMAQLQQEALHKAELKALQAQALANLGLPPAAPAGLDVWPGGQPQGPPGQPAGPGGPVPAAHTPVGPTPGHVPPQAGNAAGPHRTLG